MWHWLGNVFFFKFIDWEGGGGMDVWMEVDGGGGDVGGGDGEGYSSDIYINIIYPFYMNYKNHTL